MIYKREEELHFNRIWYIVSEESLISELCQHRQERIERVNELRKMRLNEMKVNFAIHEENLFEQIKEDFGQNKGIQHLKSLDIGANYEQIIKAISVMETKPDRVNMKFESFDHKFQICFADKNNFQGMCKLIHKYYYFKQGIVCGNPYERRLTAAFKKKVPGIQIHKINLNASESESVRDT